ncbi:hypothetical protein [Paracidobacterium acidisoli]|uniref:hypothetical protein n=1 Tax=Paracidobacterium acidisoli TaxID=2303751 RepID=UPI0011C1B1BE|nr:hypothetical protein [Paracidobacterium acidisoli]MBT9331799.1 hypothetical protein [Paracidobacterium acidisoli]
MSHDLQKTSPAEPIHVSSRFRLTLEDTIRRLEAGAAYDERALSRLLHPDHRRRQRLLIRGQLERAFSLRQLLDRTVIRHRAA